MKKLFAAAVGLIVGTTALETEMNPIKEKYHATMDKVLSEKEEFPQSYEPLSIQKCKSVKLCKDYWESFARHWDFDPESNQPSPIPSPNPYTAGNFTISVNDTLQFTLHNNAPNFHVAENLNVEMWFYQDGIARTVVSQTGEEPRFAISDTGLPVEWAQLMQVTNLAASYTFNATNAVIDLYNNTYDPPQHWEYNIQMDPFRIFLFVNDNITTIVNHDDSLRYASLDAPHNVYMDGYDELIEGYEIGIGFTFTADFAYGLPMRAM